MLVRTGLVLVVVSGLFFVVAALQVHAGLEVIGSGLDGIEWTSPVQAGLLAGIWMAAAVSAGAVGYRASRGGGRGAMAWFLVAATIAVAASVRAQFLVVSYIID